MHQVSRLFATTRVPNHRAPAVENSTRLIAIYGNHAKISRATEDEVALARQGNALPVTDCGGNGAPEELRVALERRFLDSGGPRDLYQRSFGIESRLHRRTVSVATIIG